MMLRSPVFALALVGVVASGILTGCGPATLPGGAGAVATTRSEIAIRPQIAGTIDRVAFEAGARVTKGQILFRLDPLPLRAETERRFIARNQAIAALDMERANRARAQRLPGKILSTAEADELNAAVLASARNLAAATAALNASKVALEFTEIRAPIDGTVSRARIKQGESVSNTSLLTTIVSDGNDPGYAHATARASL